MDASLCSLFSTTLLEASLSPSPWCYVLAKSAYGLKDAPLMWFLKLRDVLMNKLGFVQSRHDPCMFYKLSDPKFAMKNTEEEIFSKDIIISLSLHVDDILCTGLESDLLWLEDELRKEFVEITTERNHFRHYGVDCFRCPRTFNVFSSQQDYLEEIRPIALPSSRVSKETLCNAAEVTEYRSVVAAIAWVGVTFAPAATARTMARQERGAHTRPPARTASA